VRRVLDGVAQRGMHTSVINDCGGVFFEFHGWHGSASGGI
jgi:hypothetical protein